MTLIQDPALRTLIAGVLALLVLSSIAGSILDRRVSSASARATVDNINARIRAWWVMAGLFVIAVTMGTVGSILLFALISFLALREFVTLAPTKPGDHRALFWSFFVVTPVQYYLIWMEWYGLFSILIPVYVSIFLAIRTTLAGDTERFLERTRHQPVGADDLRLLRELRAGAVDASHSGIRTAGTEADVLPRARRATERRAAVRVGQGASAPRPIAPSISPNKTWEGFVGGVVSRDRRLEPPSGGPRHSRPWPLP